MSTPENPFALPELSEEELQHMREELDKRSEERRYVATKGYATWLIEFAANNNYVSDNVYLEDPYDGADPDMVRLVPDFVDLAVGQCRGGGVKTDVSDAPFPTQEVNIIVDDDTILTAGFMHGQGTRYYLHKLREGSELDQPRVRIADIVAEA